MALDKLPIVPAQKGIRMPRPTLISKSAVDPGQVSKRPDESCRGNALNADATTKGTMFESHSMAHYAQVPD